MITNLIQHGNTLSFDVEDYDVAVVNALRRVLIAEVPTVAIDEKDVTFIKNTCALHDQILAHRISLLPLHFSKEEIEHFRPDKYKFVLKEINTGTDMKDITSNMIVIVDSNGKRYSKDFHERVLPFNKITNDYVLLTKLKPNIINPAEGDVLHFEAYGSVGTGKQHARWSPVSLCTFWNKLDEESVKQGLEEYVEKMAKSGLTIEALRKRFETLEKYRYYQKNRFGEACCFHFELESECALSPLELVTIAIDVLVNKLQDIILELEKQQAAKASRVSIEQSQGMSFITIHGEDHTLGNLLQAMMYNAFVRDKHEIDYIGYYKPHPLEDHIVVKIKANNDVVDILKKGCEHIINTMQAFSREWDGFK